MRRMRLGDKSIERDAARLRALLGAGGTGSGGNPPFVPALGGITYGGVDRVWGGNPQDFDYVYGVDILGGVYGGAAFGCFGVVSGTSSITTTPLLQLETRTNTGLWVTLSNDALGYSPIDGDLGDTAGSTTAIVSPDGEDLKVADELAYTINITISKEILVLRIIVEDTGTIEGCRILGWIIS